MKSYLLFLLLGLVVCNSHLSHETTELENAMSEKLTRLLTVVVPKYENDLRTIEGKMTELYSSVSYSTLVKGWRWYSKIQDLIEEFDEDVRELVDRYWPQYVTQVESMYNLGLNILHDMMKQHECNVIKDFITDTDNHVYNARFETWKAKNKVTC